MERFAERYEEAMARTKGQLMQAAALAKKVDGMKAMSDRFVMEADRTHGHALEA